MKLRYFTSENEKIEFFESEKKMLQKHVGELKHANLDLQNAADDNEQYVRRRVYN